MTGGGALLDCGLGTTLPTDRKSVNGRLDQEEQSYLHRVLIAVSVTTAVLVSLWVLWAVVEVVLLMFAGVLAAVILHTLAAVVARYLHLSWGLSLALIVLGIVTALAAVLILFGPQISQGFDALLDNAGLALRYIDWYLRQYEWGRLLAIRLSETDWMPAAADVFQRLAGIFSTAVGLLGSLILVVFVGVYLSSNPKLYASGVIRLIPLKRRPRAKEVLTELAHVLRRFLLGRFASMLIVGLLTWAGLALLGVPTAFMLAAIAAVLDFIPNIGPVIAAVPAILIAFTQNPSLALYVIVMYGLLQMLEGYVITPLIQQQMVELPPVWLLFVQLVMGLTFGLLGLLLAEAIAVVLMVIVQMIYVTDVLGDTIEPPSERS